MFTILGSDGKEYGPYSVTQVHSLMREGRANAQTQCRREGEAAWSNLGSLPEFSSASPNAGAAPTPPVSLARSVDPKKYADAILEQRRQFDFGAALGTAWDLMKSDYWKFVGVTLLMTIIIGAVGSIPFLGLLITGVLVGGHHYYYLKKLRGEPVVLGDCFIGFSFMLLPLILASLVSTLLTIVGIILLILPGIYLAVAYTFTYLLILDHRLEFWPAMEVSRRVITRSWGWIFLLIIVAGLISSLGLILFLIGFVLTAPFFYAAIIAAYEQLIGRPQS